MSEPAHNYQKVETYSTEGLHVFDCHVIRLHDGAANLSYGLSFKEACKHLGSNPLLFGHIKQVNSQLKIYPRRNEFMWKRDTGHSSARTFAGSPHHH